MSERAQTLGDVLDAIEGELGGEFPEGEGRIGFGVVISEVATRIGRTARIISGPVCETCGGDGKCPTCKGEAYVSVQSWLEQIHKAPGSGRKLCHACEDGTCPACHGEQPVWIVRQPDWEQFLYAIENRDADVAEAPARIATALLGGRVEVAKQVGVVRCDLSSGADQAIVLEDRYMVIHHGDRLALLKNGGRDE